MPLLDDLIASVSSSDDHVRRIVYTHRWIMVEGLGCGFAPNPAELDLPHVDQSFQGKRLVDLLELTMSQQPVEAALGTAALNSLLCQRADFDRFRITYLPRARGKRLVIIGKADFMGDLEETAAEVRNLGTIHEIENSRDLVSEADMVLISAEAVLVNRLEHVLGLTETNYTVVFGPSTPLSPLLFAYGCDHLVGAVVTNTEEVIRQLMTADIHLQGCSGIRTVVMARPQQSR
ncbi:MAG TPA: hypothetical protein ENI46_02375 [Firmicutes bacterium]|nr:hypothetical protein [Bacillota bacterium]